MNGIPVRMPCCRRFMGSTSSWGNAISVLKNKNRKQKQNPKLQQEFLARSKRFCSKAAESETPRRILSPPAHPSPVGTRVFPVCTLQVLSDPRTPLETVFNVLEIKNPQGLDRP